jgi:hypothetical protein
MGRYYSPHNPKSTQSSSTNSLRSTSVSTSARPPWWKSPAILAAGSLGFVIIGVTLFVEMTTQRVIHIRADDRSDSAKSYALQQLQHCQASNQQYKPGDTIVTIRFADQPDITQNITLSNGLSLLGQCQQTQTPITDMGKAPGTSLVRLLENIQTIIKKQRDWNNSNSVVVTMTLQAAEPGPNQPDLDWQHVKTLVHSITSSRGAIAIIGPTGQLQNQLETQLLNERNVRICSFNDVRPCVDWAFETGRHLKTN